MAGGARRNDFAAFRPHLERSFELARREADYLGYREHPYDALLDDYEPELTSREVRALFDRLLEVTVPLVRAITERGTDVPGGVLDAAYAEAPQRAFGLATAQAFGYDLTRGRLDVSAHPFCTDFSRDDVRITTRFGPSGLGAVFGIFHESGHAMYGQGIAASLSRTPLADGAGMGIHESQSRMWENLVGRSRGFWEHAFPALRAAFPWQLEAVAVDEFYRAINRVRPTLIRVDADEVTYNLHIILRFELEQAVLTGAVRVADLPEAWNAKMTAYLGTDAAHGCRRRDAGHALGGRSHRVLSVVHDRQRRVGAAVRGRPAGAPGPGGSHPAGRVRDPARVDARARARVRPEVHAARSDDSRHGGAAHARSRISAISERSSGSSTGFAIELVSVSNIGCALPRRLGRTEFDVTVDRRRRSRKWRILADAALLKAVWQSAAAQLFRKISGIVCTIFRKPIISSNELLTLPIRRIDRSAQTPREA